MLAAFASIEDRVNAAVVARLSNRLVTAGALTFQAIFEDAGTVSGDGMYASTEPRLSAVPEAIALQLVPESELTVTHPGTLVLRTFEFVRAQADGAGFYTLMLRKAS